MTNLSALETSAKPKDPRWAKVKFAEIPINTIVSLLTMNGEVSYKMDGWPQDSVVIGMKVQNHPSRLVLALYHPDFPVVLGKYPEFIKVTARAVH